MSDISRPPAGDEAASERKEQYLARVSHVQMGLAPKTFEEGLRMAELLARSTLVPEAFRGNAGNVLIAIQLGMEVGLPPMQALQSIAVIGGKPSLYGDGLLALVQASPVFEWIAEDLKDGVASCTVKRRGWPNPVVRTYSIDDAKRASLWNKSGPWQTNPNRMLQMRARAFALRDVFADVLRGLASAEEMLDVSGQVTVTEKPDPLVTMRNDLNCSEEQFAQIVDLWDSLKVPPPQRIIQAKKYSNRAVELAQMLIDMGAPLPVPPSIAAPPVAESKVVTKPQRRRLAKAMAEGKPVRTLDEAKQQVAAATVAVAESIAAALGPDTGEAHPTCEHGVVIDEPCDQCVAFADELAATAKAPTEPAALPSVAPAKTLPF